jgi:Flp pilus assembly pilin Flp
MQRIRSFLASLEQDQRGLTTVEYAIILCLIVAVTVGTWDTFGAAVAKKLETDTGVIETAITTPPP